MELDLYCEELKLAIEYNGAQHYKFCKFYHTTIENFQQQIARDILKNKLCSKNDVRLITVPYTVKNIGKFIMHAYNRTGELEEKEDEKMEEIKIKPTSGKYKRLNKLFEEINAILSGIKNHKIYEKDQYNDFLKNITIFLNRSRMGSIINVYEKKNYDKVYQGQL